MVNRPGTRNHLNYERGNRRQNLGWVGHSVELGLGNRLQWLVKKVGPIAGG
jgi:hypothetical protein